jgi:hypothetical protein
VKQVRHSTWSLEIKILSKCAMDEAVEVALVFYWFMVNFLENKYKEHNLK